MSFALTSQPKWFQLFHPIGGVRASPLSCRCSARAAPTESAAAAKIDASASVRRSFPGMSALLPEAGYDSGMKASRLLFALSMVTLTTAPILAQRGRGFNPGFRVDPSIEKIPYDGRFTLVRLSFTTNSPMGYY